MNLTVGLLDWCEPVLPTAENIAGARVLRHGMAHIKTIRLSGGNLLGHRSLEDDGGWERLLGFPDPGPGFDEVTWGYLVIEDIAHSYFGRHFPERPTPAVERPAPLQTGWREP